MWPQKLQAPFPWPVLYLSSLQTQRVSETPKHPAPSPFPFRVCLFWELCLFLLGLSSEVTSSSSFSKAFYRSIYQAHLGRALPCSSCPTAHGTLLLLAVGIRHSGCGLQKEPRAVCHCLWASLCPSVKEVDNNIPVW